MRQSNDEYRDGKLWNGYDYELQVWVMGGVVARCGHPAQMRQTGPCCNADRYQGVRLEDAQAAEATRRGVRGRA